MTHKLAYGHQIVIQGQGHFTKCGLPWVISPVMRMGYEAKISVNTVINIPRSSDYIGTNSRKYYYPMQYSSYRSPKSNHNKCCIKIITKISKLPEPRIVCNVMG